MIDYIEERFNNGTAVPRPYRAKPPVLIGRALALVVELLHSTMKVIVSTIHSYFKT